MVESIPFSDGPQGRVGLASSTPSTPEPTRPSGPPLKRLDKLRELAADIKLHHSIFALPWAILATVLAAHRTGGLKIGQLLLVLLCMVTGRTVAMVANRLLDAKFDAANPRTARRALPAARLSPQFMWLSVVVSSLCFLAGAAGFWFLYRNDWPIILAIPVLLFLVGYSLMKRYTRLCHYYLGAALALAPLCAWLAVAGRIGLPPLLMAGAVVLWTAGFDILYACQDYAFDVQTGLFSIPARIGIAPALWVSRLSHLLCVALLIALDATTPELGLLFALGIGLATVLLIVEHSLVKPNDLSRLNLAFFTLNGVISLLLGGLGVCDVVLSHRQGADLAREFNAKVERRMLPTPICSEMQSQTPFRRPGLAGVISRNPQGTPGGDRGAALLLQPSAPLKEYLSGRG